MTILCISLINAQNSAPSSSIVANDNGAGDILYRVVRNTITTNATYFCTMQWNAGAEGGAYCGFQDSPDRGHVFIYSIWDPTNGQAITAPYIAPGTIVESFGGEGTGLKSLNGTIGWDLNEWNTVVTRRWSVGSHTFYGFWIRRNSQNKWYHMVTMDYPVANVTFNGQTTSFLEDWLSTGANKRRFEVKEAFKRKTNGTWKGMSQVVYYRNDEPRSSNYTNKIDAGVTNNNVIYYQSGGNSTPSFSGTPPKTFNLSTGSSPSSPTIAFSITSLTNSNVEWLVPVSSTPQFKYTIKVNGVEVASVIATETFNRSIPVISESDIVEVILEDILGRTSSISTTIGTLSNEIVDDPIGSKIYPNPTSNYINIQMKEYDLKNKALDLFDLKGAKVISKEIKSDGKTHKIDISDLPKGIYILRLGSDFVKKVVVN